jgi:hypothetical protein
MGLSGPSAGQSERRRGLSRRCLWRMIGSIADLGMAQLSFVLVRPGLVAASFLAIVCGLAAPSPARAETR